MDEILNKVDDIIFKLKNNDKFKKIYILKKKINSNKKIKELIKNFNDCKENNSNLLYIKTKLYNNSIIKEYLDIQNELDFIILYLNNNIFSLISNKSCHKENS